MAATLVIAPDGRVVEATPDALTLLGVDLPELRALPPGSFSPDPPDPEADAAFREQWDAQGQPDIVGEATLQRLDASKVRVRFVITHGTDGDFVAVLEPIDAPVEQPAKAFTAGQLLASWRSAERRLTTLEEGSAEWAAVADEIESFRTRYQSVFQR